LRLDLSWLSFSDPGVLNAPPVHHHEPPSWEYVQTFEQALKNEISNGEWATWLSNIKVHFSRKGYRSGRPELTYTVPAVFSSGSKTMVATFTATTGLFVRVVDQDKIKSEVGDQEVAYEYALPPGLKLKDIPAWFRPPGSRTIGAIKSLYRFTSTISS
jgi:hypothetical protein